MRLLPGAHLVASGSGGVDLTDPFDCNVYLIDGGDEVALVDAGIGRATDELCRNIEASGVGLDRVRYVLLTHAHPDHSGGAAALSEVLPRADIAASAAVADWVGGGDERAMSVANGKRAGFYPRDFRFTPCRVGRVLEAAELFTVGDVSIQAIDTPGHAAGHLSFHAAIRGRKALFCGDLLFYGGRISLVGNDDCDLAAYAASIGRVNQLEVDALFPGHHEVTLARGHRHIASAYRSFSRGFVPPSIV